MTRSIVPIFVSLDLDATEKFYTEILGFRTDGKHDDYLMMVTDTIQIHFSKLTNIDFATNYCACYINVSNLDELYEQCQAANCVHPNGKLEQLPWGREFAISDPDFNLIKIAE